MAYFDNAATTFPKPEDVYDFMDKFYRDSGASAGRGKYKKAATAGKLISESRKLLQDLLHCPAKQVIFTPTATIALNITIQGMLQSGIKTVYISPFEHNSVTRVLRHYEEKQGIHIEQLCVTDDMQYDLKRIEYQFASLPPELVIVSHASNVFGLIAPIEEIFALAKKYNSVTLVDMSQTAGVIDLNVGLETIDFAVFAGHKTLYGPTGISGFVMKPSIKLEPILFGGTGVDSANQDMPANLPERFEMGTLNILGIAGLNAALKWNQSIGVEKIHKVENDNRKRLLALLDRYDFIHVIGNYSNQHYVGIVSCIIDGISSDSAGTIFDSQGISVRTGLDCSPLAHKFAKTFPAGTIRFSVGYFNTEEDFKELKRALDYIEENL